MNLSGVEWSSVEPYPAVERQHYDERAWLRDTRKTDDKAPASCAVQNVRVPIYSQCFLRQHYAYVKASPVVNLSVTNDTGSIEDKKKHPHELQISY